MSEKREIEIVLKSKNAQAGAKALTRDVKGVGSAADKSEQSMLSLSKVASAISAALATRQIQTYADSWTNTNNRIRAATATQEEFIRAQQGVIAIAQEAGVSIESVADGYSRIAQNTAELGISQQKMLNVTKKVTLAIKAGGATAQETASIIVQLGQGLGSGALQGDELKSIMEASIPITKALAKEFGVNTGQLKKLGSEGKITADRVVAAIEKMDEKSLTFTKDISTGFTEVTNALTVYIGQLDESVGATQKISVGLSVFASNIDTVIKGAALLVTLVGAKYVGALGSAIASQLTLAAASLKGTVQMNALGVVTSRTTVAMNASAIAARGLTSALALVGGPVGLAVIAAAALYAFSDGADYAKNKATETADEVNLLAKSFANLSATRRGTLLNETELEMKILSERLTAANEKLIKFKNFADSPIKSNGIRQAQQEIAALNEEMDALSIKQGALIGAPDLSGGTERNFKDGVEVLDAKPLAEPESEDTSAYDSLVARLKLETQAMMTEEAIRQAFRDEKLTQDEMNYALELQNIYAQYEARRLAIDENERLTAEQKLALKAELDAQEIAAEEAKQNQMTSATQKGNKERSELDRMIQNEKIDNIKNGAQAGLSLLSMFGKKSSKLQKTFAIADAVVNIASGIAKALNNPFPANLGFAAQVASQGAALISTIKGSKPGGGGITPTVAAAKPVATAPPPTPSAANQSQNRVINFVGLENFGPNDFIPMTKSQFIDYVSQSEDVNVAINNGQKTAARTGAI